MNSVLIQGRDFQNYLNYFDLKPNFSIEELERKRYIKEKEDIKNIENINNMYKSLLEIKLNDLTLKNKDTNKEELHKSLFVKEFNEKYNKKFSTFKNKDALNNKINGITNTINNVTKESDINKTYDEYVSQVSDFMNLYSIELDKKNKSQVTDIIESNKDKVVNNVSNILNDSLDVLISNYNNNVHKDVIDCKVNNYLLLTINSAFKDVQNFYNNEKYDYILSDYRPAIETFLLTKYNYYIKNFNDKNIESEEQRNKAVETFYKDFKNSIHAYSSSLFRKIYSKIKQDLDSSRLDNVIDNSLYTILNMQLEKSTNFDDLAKIYYRLHEDNKRVSFAK